jgi:lipopolysaccharide export system permease protein
MTILDRYLLTRYLQVFAITFLALFGLFVIIDAFSNADDFLDRPEPIWQKLLLIGEFYVYRSSLFLNIVGGTVSVVAALASTALVHRYGELNPVLSAGIPTWRLLRPILIGTAIANVLVSLNEEFIIPEVAPYLQAGAAHHQQSTSDVEPTYDLATQLHVSGRSLRFRDQTLERASFALHESWSPDSQVIEAFEAKYEPANKRRPGGWRCTGVSPEFSKIQLTEAGRKHVRRIGDTNDIFIVTDVSVDRLYKRDQNFEYLSTAELLKRVKNPSFGANSLRRQSQFMHARLMEPFLNLSAVLLGMPFILRKEGRNLIANMAVGSCVSGLVFVVNMGCQYLCSAQVLAPDAAAWYPIVLTGAAAAWFQSIVRS